MTAAKGMRPQIWLRRSVLLTTSPAEMESEALASARSRDTGSAAGEVGRRGSEINTAVNGCAAATQPDPTYTRWRACG